jgi:hypothetical protein
MRLLAAALALPLLLGPIGAAAQAPQCRVPQQPQEVAELYFGRNIGERLGVSERSFARFLEREIVPRFPDGLTVLDSVGHWRDGARKRLQRERGKLVHIVLPGHADDLERLAAIAEAYKKRFRQRSVGIVLRSACVSF